MNLRNNLKNKIINSKSLPAFYTFFTTPLAPKLRHLPHKFPKVPAHPKTVTAIIPNYNYAKYLPLRIESIIFQTYPVSELIILDDASTDNSDEVIKQEIKKLELIRPDLKVKYLKNKINTKKPILQWQKGFKEATGDFVWICEADDLSDLNFLAMVMSAFEDNNVVLSYSNSVAINGKNRVLAYDFATRSDKYRLGHWQNSYINDGQAERKLCLNRRCSIPNVSAVVFRNDKIIPFNTYLKEAEQFTQVGDWYFYLKVLKHGKIAFKKPSLNYFRIHGNSVTGKSKKAKKHEEEIDWIHSHIDMI